MSDSNEPVMDKPQQPARKKAGRKKVAKKKQVHKPKSRGRYNSSQPAVAKQLTRDLAECIFSDDEERRDYIIETCGNDSDGSSSSVQPLSDTSVESSIHGSTHESISTDMEGHESIAVSTDLDSESSVLSPTPDSRPSSAFSRPGSSVDCSLEPADVDGVSAPPDLNPPLPFINQGLQAMNSRLPPNWTTIVDQTGFHFLFLSSRFPKAIQREVFVSFGGNVLISVHCVLLPSYQKLFELPSKPSVQFREECFEQYCDFCVMLVKKCKQFDVCVGANDVETREVWSEISSAGYIDLNPYKEESYQETFRSLSCHRLVEWGRAKRCKSCTLLLRSICKRKEFLLSPSADATVNNKYLTKQQASAKLKSQSEAIRKKDKQLAWLRSRCKQILEAEGCNIDEDLSEYFSSVLSSSKLSQNQQMFLNEQWTASNKSDARAHRWHPAMIRFALHLHMVSNAAYETLRESGVIKLPCARTLFDYSHAIKATDGINPGLVGLVHDSVKKFEEPFKHYHNLLCDGMHISQNLVFRSSDGSLVGVTYLDEIDKEMEVFEKYVEGKEAILSEPQLATEMLAYMVKGIATDIKCVIAAFPCKVLTKEMLYKRSWEVINICEKAGIKILALICDGYSVNRAFFLMHVPLSSTDSNIVFDTLNFCSPELRPIFFYRMNCFYNSGEGAKKTRLMQINGEKIEWKTIVRLYMTYKDSNFRKSYKLNPQNVFPNPFSRMRVRYAAQVLSSTVASDLETQNWEGTGETIRFIRLCDKFFGVLNGAHSSQSRRLLKPDLAPYESVDDPRFHWLENTFLKYLKDWKAQVDGSTSLDSSTKDKCMLSHQTITGIEITIRGFISAVKYFLNPEHIGGKFLMARCFSQDPLEQHFSKQRGGGGGSRHPNASQFESKMVPIALQRDLGIKKKRGNVTAEGDSDVTWSDERLPKRPRCGKK
ncbi:Transposable element P transposase [Frankliniella fusca]|uniref:Transposable element P transposase n=1 Tax=Frankliniella fusca TaxID=407009 RepID=A0AAE1HAV6_9NEOP|nr:Transposable element P transposase [Frankliniella fusca]